MVPAPRARPEDGPVPPDLLHLRELYQALPHPRARWQTEPGGRFLDLLFACVDEHHERAVAAALNVSITGVHYMLERPRLARPRPWPSQDELRTINAAWRVMHACRKRTVRRTSTAYIPVHRALVVLLHQYTLGDIALAMNVPLRSLVRFIEPPLASPEDVARAIDELLPNQAGERPKR
jgi:hypothetical protein